MEIIYIDLHFFLNLLTDYLILLSSALVCSLRLKRLRYLLSALVGASYSVLALLPKTAFLFSAAAKLICFVLMAIIAYGGEKEPLRCTGVFLGVSALFGGFVYAAGGLLPIRSFVLCFALCYCLISLFFRGRAELPKKKRVDVQVELSGQRACFMALVDTGNSLSDPLSGEAVLIACPHALKPLFREEAELLDLSPTELIAQSAKSPKMKGRFRLLPYKAVGSRGMLAAFRADRILVCGKEEKGLLVALSDAAAGDGFEAII